MDTVYDQYTFAGFMDYFVNQIVVMNAYAVLFSVRGEVRHARVEAATTRMREVREATAALRGAATWAFGRPYDSEANPNGR